MKIKTFLLKPLTGDAARCFPLGYVTSNHTHIGSITLSHESSGIISDARALQLLLEAIEAGANISIEFPEIEIRLS